MAIQERPLKKPNLLQRLFGWEPSVNAVLKLRNLLAEKGVMVTTPEEVEQITSRYDLNPAQKFPTETRSIYREYLQSCLKDKSFSNDNLKALKHLKDLLGLKEETINKIQEEVASKLYRESLDEALEDANISKEEKDFLQEVRKSLKLPDKLAHQIENEAKQNKIQTFLEDTLKDERLSPEEEEQLYTLADNLNVELNLKEKTKQWLQRYKLYWLVENGTIPEIDADIHLYKKEKCYYITDVEYYERKKKTNRLRYAGPTARIKLAKGIYWRMGDLGFQPTGTEELTQIDRGQLYITSHRVIFKGSKESTMIRLNRILDFELYENGLEIQKNSGKNPFFGFNPQDPRLFAMILNRAIEDYNN